MLQAEFIERHGGHWGSHPNYPVDDWQSQVANGDTRLGYWDWVFDEMAAAGIPLDKEPERGG